MGESRDKHQAAESCKPDQDQPDQRSLPAGSDVVPSPANGANGAESAETAETAETAEPPESGLTREQRIERLRRQAEELTGESMLWGRTDHLPPEIEEAFWKQIIAYESAEPIDLFKMLVDGGVSLPPPVLVTEEAITITLWEVIYFLASVGCYLENTDHLSDRELYTMLHEELLRQPAILFPNDPCYAYHIDLIGSGSSEETEIYLRYYASEEERRRWQEADSDRELPQRQPVPYDRDRLLPRPFHHFSGATM